MLTNEEALRLIKQCDECFVVWATDRNVVVAVHPLPNNATGKDRLQAMESFGTDYEGPTMGRFFTSKNVTLQMLRDVQASTSRVARRVEIFNSWNRYTVDELIDVVIKRRFFEPMDEYHGSRHIVERLYKIHSPWLTESQLTRLERFAYSAAVAREQRSAQRDLQCYLIVLRNQPERLRCSGNGIITPSLSSWAVIIPITITTSIGRHGRLLPMLSVICRPPIRRSLPS
jgi:hypothetical protein